MVGTLFLDEFIELSLFDHGDAYESSDINKNTLKTA
jgi:hypothetical protein